jgi:site-specific DNA recombinase
VAIAAQQILSDRAAMLEVIERAQLKAPDIRGTLDSASALCRRLQDQAAARTCMSEIIDRIELCDDGIRVALKLSVPCSHAGVRTSSIVGLTRFVPLAMKRRGVETRVVISGAFEPPRTVDPALLKAVSRARVWFDELASGGVRSLAEVARREGITRRYVERLARLAFVAPSIVEAICRGQQPAELSAETLLNRIKLPLAWPEQEQALGIR